MKETKKLSLFQAIDKISNGEWLLVEDVKALLNNKHEGLVFFEREELTKRITPILRFVEKGSESKANNQARGFVVWMNKQLKGVET